jgi:hypothetical protein
MAGKALSFQRQHHNISAVNGLLISIKGKWYLNCRGLERTSRAHSLALYILGCYSKQFIPIKICERPGIPVYNAIIPLKENFTGQNHLQ